MFGKKNGKTASSRGGDLTAFIDEASEIEGKYTFSEIISTDTLIIGEKAVVNASIRAGIVLISGEVVGNVLAGERVELRGTARVFGDVEAPVVVVEEGVTFEGKCRMTRETDGAAAAVSPDSPVRSKR